MTPATQMSVQQQVTAEEWEMRVHLAAAYRLVALYGWDDIVFTHISARVPGPEHHFLINPYGLLFEEVTASNLVKVNLAGEIVLPSPYPVNPAGFVIHSAIHEARPDALCVMHTHTAHGVAVAAQKDGLLPLSQQALFPLASLAYHAYEGVVLHDAEKPRLVQNLGDKMFLILRNHGLLTIGRHPAEAFLGMYILESACQRQILAQSGGAELNHVHPQIVAGMKAAFAAVTKGLGADIAWPALLRKLDRLDASFRD